MSKTQLKLLRAGRGSHGAYKTVLLGHSRKRAPPARACWPGGRSARQVQARGESESPVRSDGPNRRAERERGS
eukprot:scaffold7429_cov417-Prasinococcus_capsulatus_cf.AAC.5